MSVTVRNADKIVERAIEHIDNIKEPVEAFEG